MKSNGNNTVVSEKYDQPGKATHSGNGDETLGLKVREIRNRHGWTLKQLSVLSGLNINTLSMIEKGKTSPSIYTMQRLADALDVPIKEFFEAVEETKPVIFTRNDQRPRSSGEKTLIENLGKGLKSSTLEPFVVILEKFATSGGRTLFHSGYEFVYCLSGTVMYYVQEVEYLLNPGDSLLFSAQIGHRWENVNDGESRLLLVMTPACGFIEQSKKHFYPFEKED
jgi:transcriptional regulator with XRE-family HTH domain